MLIQLVEPLAYVSSLPRKEMKLIRPVNGWQGSTLRAVALSLLIFAYLPVGFVRKCKVIRQLQLMFCRMMMMNEQERVGLESE